jgi:hypothetical protein
MLFSIHVAQQDILLRHYDIKLLNFFLARPMLPAGLDGLPVVLRYGVFGAAYEVPLLQDQPSLCMLADFGTADISPATLGKPVGCHHLTTLENSPPEILFCGSDVLQGFAADCFALGLCVLHLLTGLAPYEEVLGTLHCPAELRSAVEVHAALMLVPCVVVARIAVP